MFKPNRPFSINRPLKLGAGVILLTLLLLILGLNYRATNATTQALSTPYESLSQQPGNNQLGVTSALTVPVPTNNPTRPSVADTLASFAKKSQALQITEPGWYQLTSVSKTDAKLEVTEYWSHIGDDGLMFESAMRVTVNDEVTQYGITVNGKSWNNSGDLQIWGVDRFPFTLGNNWVNSLVDYSHQPKALLQEQELQSSDLSLSSAFFNKPPSLKRFSVRFPIEPAQPLSPDGRLFTQAEHSITVDAETGLGLKYEITGTDTQGQKIIVYTQTESLTKIELPPQEILDLLKKGIPQQ